MGFFDFFSNIYNALTDPMLKYIILYLFVTLYGLVSYTEPTFGFDLLNLKMLEDVSLETIGFGYPELYFYLGYILIFAILTIFTTYNRIERCLVEYKKKDPKYENYSIWDFFKESDAYKKSLGTIITPFVIFIIITLVYVGLNNAGKFVPPVKIGTVIVNYGMSLIVPIINIVLFIIYFTIIDSNIPC
jgi:hypothetical protein